MCWLDDLRDYFTDVLWEDIFKLNASTVNEKVWELVQIEIDKCNPELQIWGQASLISLVFRCFCCWHISQKSFFVCTDKKSILDLKEKSDRLGIGSLHKSITLMQDFFKALFLVQHVSYYILMNFLMILSAILLSVLMIQLFTLSMIEHLVPGNN